ncbi:unnamed protein product [Gongylonema pulchrum]|uniref:Protein-glutamate O-methyltransferase CheR n=1 Tax=Gongylonema pulchrum TaxID=637853 RepID=A0A183DMN0_9BILA|nr:unnamed protein product [Gongylonema pulchrum]
MNSLEPETTLRYKTIHNAILAELKEHGFAAVKAFKKLAKGVFQRNNEQALEFRERVKALVRRPLPQVDETLKY